MSRPQLLKSCFPADCRSVGAESKLIFAFALGFLSCWIWNSLSSGFPSMVSDYPLQAGLVTSGCVLPIFRVEVNSGSVMTVEMEVPSSTESFSSVTLLLLFISLRSLEGK